MVWTWTLKEQECPGCGICADLCPHQAIDMPWEQGHPVGVDGACVGCLVCVAECPFDAIVVWRRVSGVPA